MGFGIRRGPMIRTAPGSAAFPAASCVHGTRHNGTHRCPGHTARHPVRLARRDRRGSPGRCVHSPRRRIHPASTPPVSTVCAPYRNTRVPLHWVYRSHPFLVRYAIAVAYGMGCVAALLPRVLRPRHPPRRIRAQRASPSAAAAVGQEHGGRGGGHFHVPPSLTYGTVSFHSPPTFLYMSAFFHVPPTLIHGLRG